MKVSICDSSQNHINVQIIEGNNAIWRLTCFYGFPEREKRRESWDFIRYLAGQSQLPWCIIGDFNDLMYASDKNGTHPHPQWLLDGFRNTIEECDLVELDLTGGNYTWEKSRGTTNWVREKLDRAFANNAWWNQFPLCKHSVSHTITSDHDPIKLELMCVGFSKRQFRFKIENTWLKEKEFHKDVASFWKDLPPTHLLPKLLSISSFMAKWGRTFFHKFRDKVKRQKEIINSLVDCVDDVSVKCYFEEKDKLHSLLLHEETYWKQRAKVFWLEEGDSNTSFFMLVHLLGRR